MVLNGIVPITLSTPDVNALGRVARDLAEFQSEVAGVQLPPGDLGWY